MNEDPVLHDVNAGAAAGAGTSIALAGVIILAGESATFRQRHSPTSKGP
jgi:hypothetical protein